MTTFAKLGKEWRVSVEVSGDRMPHLTTGGSGSKLCAKVGDRTPAPNEEVLVSTALNGKPSFSRSIQVKFNLTFLYPTQSRIQIIS